MEDARRCLALVIPCYNEAATIKSVVDRVLTSPFTDQVIVVDDGSTDGSLEIVLSIADDRVRVIAQGINLGKGAALRRGFAEVTSPYVMAQDADLEYDPDDYEAMIAPLRDGVADAVFGSRFTGNPHRVLYYWHAVANRWLTLASNAVTNLNLSDVTTGAKAFRREVIQSLELEQDRFGIEFEITAKLAEADWRIFEVGVSYDGRTYEEGKKFRWTDGALSVYWIARYSPLGSRLTNPRRTLAHSRDVSFEEADSELEDSLDNLDGASNYADWIVAMVAPHIRGDIIEIGAGHGTMAARLTTLGHVTANEPSTRAVAVLHERFGNDPLVTVAEGYAADVMTPGSFDAAVMINVLEHIPDDLGVLRGIFDGLRPGGTLAVFVPAHEALYSHFDHVIGHRRRYRRSTLNQVLSQAGFDIVDLRYVNVPGAFAWLLIARLLRKQPTESSAARVFDRVIVPVLRRFETGRTPPFGLSLLAIGRRPDHD